MFLYDLITNADEILVGDGTGVDWLVQKYLDNLHYKKVTVYTYGGNKCCRSNVGAWEEKKHRLVGNTLLTSKIERDFYLIEDADNGIIIWDGECRESYICMLYLISIGKKCRLYLMSEDKWIDIESIEELSNFAGDEGTIDREDVREVLERCGFSEQMIEYSVANDTVSPWTLVVLGVINMLIAKGMKE